MAIKSLKEGEEEAFLLHTIFYDWNIWLSALAAAAIFFDGFSLVINSLQQFFSPPKNDFSASSFSISFLCNKPLKRKWGMCKRQHGVLYHKTVKLNNWRCSSVVLFAHLMLLMLLLLLLLLYLHKCCCCCCCCYSSLSTLVFWSMQLKSTQPNCECNLKRSKFCNGGISVSLMRRSFAFQSWIIRLRDRKRAEK